MDELKMVKLFLVLAFAITVASQPLETIGTSGEATQTNQLWNWVEIGWEELMDFAKRIIGCNTEEEETTTSEYIFTIFFVEIEKMLLHI